MPGVRTIERPLEGGGSFRLAYTRTGPEGELPILVIPDGPGLAAVLPYQRLRTTSEKLGLNLLMMEHRGVGLSRVDQNGADLPRKAIAITEVLDDAAGFDQFSTRMLQSLFWDGTTATQHHGYTGPSRHGPATGRAWDS